MFSERYVRFTRAMHLNIDLLQHGLEITSYLGIPKTQYTIALLLQPPLPRAIVPRRLAIAVVSAVDLDDETFCWAEKIDDIGTKRRLPPKMSTAPRKLFQRAPKQPLMRCRISPQFSCRAAPDRR